MSHSKTLATFLLSFLMLQPAVAAAYELPLFLPYPKLDTSRWYVAHGWTNGAVQSCEWRKEALGHKEAALKITISDKGGSVSDTSCGEVQTYKRYRYGLFSAEIKAAKGSGLNTSLFTYIGPVHNQPHEEIDFEILGKDTTKVQLNYYLNGKPQGEVLIDLGFDAAEDFHTYSFMWEPDKIRWYIDEKLVHQTKEGAKVPSLESKIYLTLWSGSPAVKDWLGPFKYEEDVSAYFKNVRYTPLPEYPEKP